jgi:hypothetical protein
MAGDNASCQFIAASPGPVAYEAVVTDLGGSTSDRITVSDNCGGRFGLSVLSKTFISGFWLPPVGGGTCRRRSRCRAAARCC